MANELQASYITGRSGYCLIRPATSGNLIWNNLSGTWMAYATAAYAGYPVPMTEQGTASAYYVGNFPTGITTPGSYNVVFKNMTGGSPAETDATADVGSVDWNGTGLRVIADLSTSGQIANFLPIKMSKGIMVRFFPFSLVSSADHSTPFVSGLVSGQIARDGATVWSALQSGAFTEVGNGAYWCNTITSGDVNAATALLRFTAVGVSGGAADPITLGLILQPITGQ